MTEHREPLEPDESDEPNPLALAIEKLDPGGQAKLAAACRVTPQAVNQWVKKGRAPADQVLEIEGITGVSRHLLRPDVFGHHPAAPL